MNELASLQGVLRALRDDVNSNASFFDDLEEGRRNTLQRCLNACSNTLQNVKEVVAKYRNLGVGDGKQFWQRVKWVAQRGEIDDLKSRIMIHTCNLSLCMSSIGKLVSQIGFSSGCLLTGLVQLWQELRDQWRLL